MDNVKNDNLTDMILTRQRLIEIYEQKNLKLRIEDNGELAVEAIQLAIERHLSSRYELEVSKGYTSDGYRFDVINSRHAKDVIRVCLLPGREVPIQRVEEIWEKESKKYLDDHDVIITREAYSFYRAFMIKNGAPCTTLYDDTYNRYVSPFTGGRYTKVEKLLSNAVPLAFEAAERKRKQAEAQKRRDDEDYWFERNNFTKYSNERLIDYFVQFEEENQKCHSTDRLLRIRIEAIRDLLVEKGVTVDAIDRKAVLFRIKVREFKAYYSRLTSDNNALIDLYKTQRKFFDLERATAIAEILRERGVEFEI